MSTISHALSQFGLTHNQSNVYLALLELGEAKTQDIAKRAKILRTTAYEVLEQLKAIGLATVSYRKGVRVYIGESPKKLDQLLDAKKKTIHDVLPELESLYNISGFKPKMRYYEGIEGYKTVYGDTLNVTSKRLYAILSMQDLLDTVGENYMDGYIQRRISAGIHLSVIRSETKDIKPIWPDDPKYLRMLRYAPSGFIFPLTMYIYDNKVSLMSSKHENFGMIIESHEFMETQKALFDVLWSASAKSA
ncbi:MAG: Transcriptional regulator, TrmB [Parcubacteria group bacterium GW2011_GWA2_44_12]|nr:MAG: Transcriptional regulator, TrmB [Parcubacteria group bacterium GW2011_GWA2_44_12]